MTDNLARLITQAFSTSFPAGEYTSAVVEIDLSLLTILDYERMQQATGDADTETVLHIVNKAVPDVDIRDLSITLLAPLLNAFATVSSNQISNLGSFILLYAPTEKVAIGSPPKDEAE